jgi:hypothetical protein
MSNPRVLAFCRTTPARAGTYLSESWKSPRLIATAVPLASAAARTHASTRRMSSRTYAPSVERTPNSAAARSGMILTA